MVRVALSESAIERAVIARLLSEIEGVLPVSLSVVNVDIWESSVNLELLKDVLMLYLRKPNLEACLNVWHFIDDARVFRALATILLYSFCDFEVKAPSKATHFWFSHDDYLEINGPTYDVEVNLANLLKSSKD